MINLSTWSTFYDVAHGVLFLPHWPKSYRNDKPFPAYFRRRTHHTTLRHTPLCPNKYETGPQAASLPHFFRSYKRSISALYVAATTARLIFCVEVSWPLFTVKGSSRTWNV